MNQQIEFYKVTYKKGLYFNVTPISYNFDYFFDYLALEFEKLNINK